MASGMSMASYSNLLSLLHVLTHTQAMCLFHEPRLNFNFCLCKSFKNSDHSKGLASRLSPSKEKYDEKQTGGGNHTGGVTNCH